MLKASTLHRGDFNVKIQAYNTAKTNAKVVQSKY